MQDKNSQNTLLDYLLKPNSAHLSSQVPLPSLPPTLDLMFRPSSPITEAFNRLKTNLEPNPSFEKSIRQKHNAIRSAIENIDVAIKDTKLIGSLKRKTRIQPLPNEPFDIDILVVFGEFVSWTYPGRGISPQYAMGEITKIIRQSQRYGSMHPIVDEPTLTVNYSSENIKVELVPAYLDKIGYSPDGVRHFPVGESYWIVKNGKWELADYDFDAAYISEKNLETGSILIPTIKMLKAIKRIHFKEMTSFHLEVLATLLLPNIISHRRKYNLSISYPVLVTEFFRKARRFLHTPIRLPYSNSPFLSLELLPATNASVEFGEMLDYCLAVNRLGSERKKVEYWKRLFGDPFVLS